MVMVVGVGFGIIVVLISVNTYYIYRMLLIHMNAFHFMVVYGKMGGRHFMSIIQMERYIGILVVLTTV
ncbi:TPA: hypothetical protein MH395_01655 [Klebsiella pneumoniae]|nr:hypothetical protein BME23_15495 [Klebsiella pneumoniae]PLD98117.1 hypothetical protein B6I64_22580 [Klebsiella pneumoniae]RDY56485.1 hypothetical protein DX995_00205 [Klebsiella pneumoniae]RLL43377.1 hypothetical protein D9K86_07400 [Klebsiella pneumoniae]HBX1843574.1 hypothetical protein [Klebsiella pneumoniae]